jgi:chromosome segregation ATPase
MEDEEKPQWKQSIISQLKERENTSADLTGVIQQLDKRNQELGRAKQKIKDYETIIKGKQIDDVSRVMIKLSKNLDETNKLRDKYEKLMKLYKDSQFEIQKSKISIEQKNNKIKELDKALQVEMERSWDMYHEKMVLTLEINIMKQKYEESDNNFELL